MCACCQQIEKKTCSVEIGSCEGEKVLATLERKWVGRKRKDSCRYQSANLYQVGGKVTLFLEMKRTDF